MHSAKRKGKCSIKPDKFFSVHWLHHKPFSVFYSAKSKTDALIAQRRGGVVLRYERSSMQGLYPVRRGKRWNVTLKGKIQYVSQRFSYSVQQNTTQIRWFFGSAESETKALFFSWQERSTLAQLWVEFSLHAYAKSPTYTQMWDINGWNTKWLRRNNAAVSLSKEIVYTAWIG